MCEHAGFSTPESRYDHEEQVLSFIEICDECGETLRELFTQPYLPDPKLAAA